VNGRRSADELERRIRLHLLPYFGDECDLVEAAKKLNTLQLLPPSEVRLKPDTTSEDRDGLAPTKPRSGEVGHNSGTAKPDRGPRLTVSL
jgi:hypothetical protein